MDNKEKIKEIEKRLDSLHRFFTEQNIPYMTVVDINDIEEKSSNIVSAMNVTTISIAQALHTLFSKSDVGVKQSVSAVMELISEIDRHHNSDTEKSEPEEKEEDEQ